MVGCPVQNSTHRRFVPPAAAGICNPGGNVLQLDPPDADPPFHPSLCFQSKKRAETGESVSGSYEGTVVSKHSKSCNSFTALQQPHQKSHWDSLLPWPSTAFGAVPAGTHTLGPETPDFTVLQDICVSGLRSKGLAPRETPRSTQPVGRNRCRCFGELQQLQKRAEEMKSTFLSSCDVYLPIRRALQPLE